MKPLSLSSQIFSALTNATNWMTVEEITKSISSFHPDTVRRYLRKNPAFKSAKIQGKRAVRWALSTADTSNWTPTPITAPKSRTVKTTASTQPKRAICTPMSGYAIYKGMMLMNSPKNKPSLIRAVGEILVDEFITSGKSFSAHDVTKRLREIELNKAKNATLRSPLPIRSSVIDKLETGEVYHVGYKIPRIDHEDVRNIIHDIFTAGGMPGIDRIMANDHFEYDTKDSIEIKIKALNAQIANQAMNYAGVTPP